jgi:hypothetical protein
LFCDRARGGGRPPVPEAFQGRGQQGCWTRDYRGVFTSCLERPLAQVSLSIERNFLLFGFTAIMIGVAEITYVHGTDLKGSCSRFPLKGLALQIPNQRITTRIIT